MAGVTLRNVVKSYEDATVIHGVDLDIEDGEFVVFVGPSGCGKSTLLRMIAGLEEISGGEISIGGQIMNDVPPSKRGVAMVFQTYALYPHMTVFGNMAFGLKQIKTPKDEIDRRVRDAAEKLQITDYLDRRPRNLSGGQRQRVAIGRAIVRDPEVFLFDEPLSNLDAALRVQTRVEIGRLHEELASTMIYVTHDQVEAMTLADKIVVLNGGRIEQVGSPMELYNTPANLFVAGFIGSPNMNIFKATASNGAVVVSGGKTALTGVTATGDVKLGVRPEHLVAASEADSFIAPRLQLVEHLGEYALAHLITDDGVPLTAKFDTPPSVGKGDPIPLGLDPSRAHLFSAADGARL